MLNPEKYSKLLKYPVKDKILVVFKKKKKNAIPSPFLNIRRLE